MKKIKIGVVLVLGSLLVSGCRHVTSTGSFFVRNVRVNPRTEEMMWREPGSPYLQGDHIVLEIGRSVDYRRVIDDEESEFLQLQLGHYSIGEKMAIPSQSVAPYFTIRRFGSPSFGRRFRGYLVVEGVEEGRIDARLNLRVWWNTRPGDKLKTSRFRGTYGFVERDLRSPADSTAERADAP
jgi:hypothetical protein